jgi:hypothetical protein
MRETPRKRITVTSSFKGRSMYQLGNRVVAWEKGVTPPAPHNFLSFYKQASGQMFKDDVNGFSSTTIICFMAYEYT